VATIRFSVLLGNGLVIPLYALSFVNRSCPMSMMPLFFKVV